VKSPVTASQVRHPIPGSTAEPVAPRTWDIAVLPGDGIGAEVRAELTRVLGQILPDVPVWELGPETSFPGLPYIIFPGNVGGPDALEEVVLELESKPD
jgi:hypothetical protein